MKAAYAAAMERLYLACIVVSAVALVAITLVIPYGVFMRYVMNSPYGMTSVIATSAAAETTMHARYSRSIAAE